MEFFRRAEEESGDPDITKMIGRYTRRIQGHALDMVEMDYSSG